MNVYGYVRVSTRGQSYEIQEEQIMGYCKFKEYTIVNIFADKKSGATMDRPMFQEMMAALENNPQDIKAIVVTKLDRVGRSIRDLLKFVDWCNAKGINFIAISNNIDTTIKEGRLFLYIMGALSEYERELIMERTDAGRKKFSANGGKFGRKEKQIPMETAKRLIAEGIPKAEVARRLKIDRSTLYKRLGEKKT